MTNNTPNNTYETENNSPQKTTLPPNNPIMNILQNQTNDISIDDFIQAQYQEELKRLNAERKAEKLQILEKEMNMSESDAKNRPTLNFLDENILKNIENASDEELQNVIEFITRQNIACAIGCCGDSTYPERVQEIANIHNRKFDDKFLHFHLYQEFDWTDDDWKKAIENDSEEALEYFQVYLKKTPQNTEEKRKLLKEFARIYFLAKEKSKK